MTIEVSLAEFLDKLSILSIKLSKIKDSQKLNNIRTEYDYLISKLENNQEILKDKNFLDLININELIWKAEDDIRLYGQLNQFDERFIDVAKSIYTLNDKRADIKKEINIKNKSVFIEEKSYDKK